ARAVRRPTPHAAARRLRRGESAGRRLARARSPAPTPPAAGPRHLVQRLLRQSGRRRGPLAARRDCGTAVNAALSRVSDRRGRLSPMRILVVDDDRAVRDSLRRSLEFNGYEVALANDGVEALARINGLAPDALIVDVM